MSNNLQKTLLLGFVLPVLLLIFSYNFISYNYVNYLWFDSQGQAAVWWKTWGEQIQYYFAGFAISLVGYLYAFFLASSNLKNRAGYYLSGIMRFFYLGIALFLALSIHGPSFSSLWQEFVLASNAPAFGVTDPVHGLDASFYMFRLELYSGILSWLKTTLILLTLYSISFYALPLQGVNLEQDKRAVGDAFNVSIFHLATILGLLVLVIACDAYVTRYSLLFEGSSDKLAGASYTDVNARDIAYFVYFYVGIFLALMVFVGGFLRSWKLPAFAGILWLVVYLGLIRIYPWIVQTIQVNPNEITAEKEYITRSIKYTRIAYNMNKADKRSFDARKNVRSADLKKNRTILSNIRLWDYRAILDTYKNFQEIKEYYKFRDVDIDRYNVDGELRQVLLSPRELDVSRLGGQSQSGNRAVRTRSPSWIQSHLQYTHGYGLVMSPSNVVTREGQPELWIKDFPPVVHKGLPPVKQPGIYYGEMTDDYVIVNSAIKEIDYPEAQDFATTRYKGKGGVRLGTGLRKMLIASQFDTWKMLISTEVTPDSRVLFNRQILSAARRLAPFLEYDNDPYMVVGDDGRLYWMIDAYTTSSRFPYSQRFNRDYFSRVSGSGRARGLRTMARRQINYIRNSVKVIVDAYDGTIKMYNFDKQDPVITAWSKFLPELFLPIEKMPAFLKSHLRYPELYFMLQAAIYSDYHMDNPDAFYNKEDRWAIPTELYQGTRRAMEPYYVIIKLPGEQKVEYILMIPFVPRGKKNLVAWMAARCDYTDSGQTAGDKDGKARKGKKDDTSGVGADGKNRYGELLVLDFPRTRQFYGPMQIESRIDQDAEISKEFKLWSGSGTEVIRGNLLVIPIEDSLLYVEPIYLKSTQSPFPELKRVVAADSVSVVMEDTLRSALASLTNASVFNFEPDASTGSSAAERKESGAASRSQLAREALSVMRKAERAAGAGKWEEHGRLMERLKDILGGLARSK